MQMDGTGGRQVSAFASQVLQPADENYSVSNLEVLAVVLALQHFREIIIVYKVTVYTDHAPIIDFQRQKIIWSTRSMVPNNTNVQS